MLEVTAPPIYPKSRRTWIHKIFICIIFPIADQNNYFRLPTEGFNEQKVLWFTLLLPTRLLLHKRKEKTSII